MAKILIVDDEELIRNILHNILTQDGHQVIEAPDGDVAIALARRETPDLIILDMVLPQMTGVEVAPVIRSHPNTRNVPIIALTAARAAEGSEDAHIAGCDRFMAKPIDAEILRKVVGELLSEKK